MRRVHRHNGELRQVGPTKKHQLGAGWNRVAKRYIGPDLANSLMSMAISC